MASLCGPNPVIGATDDIHATELNKLGTRSRDAAGNEYIYLKGVGSLVQYDWVTFDEAWVTIRAIANAQGRVAIAQAAVLSGQYGWFMIYGTSLGTALTAFADNGKVYLTGTGGAVDDTDVAGDAVMGAVGRSILSGTTATFEISYPMVLDLAVD